MGYCWKINYDLKLFNFEKKKENINWFFNYFDRWIFNSTEFKNAC